MVPHWDDQLILVRMRVYIGHIVTHESLVTHMGRNTWDTPHRLDPVRKVLTRLQTEGYRLTRIDKINITVTPKELAI